MINRKTPFVDAESEPELAEAEASDSPDAVEISQIAESKKRRRRRFREILSAVSLPLLGVFVGVFLWWFAVEAFNIPRFMMPSPAAVLETFQTESGLLFFHARRTIFGFLSGFAAATAFAIPLGIILTFSRTIRGIVYPLIIATQSLPKVALAPLFLVWVGFGVKSQILISFLIAFFPILINTIAGLESLPRELEFVAKSMGGNARRTFFKVRFPFALPQIFSGLRVAITLAVVGSVVGEFVGSNRGLGYLITSSSVNIRVDRAFAAIFVLAIVAFLAFWVVDLVGKLVAPRQDTLVGREGTM